MSEKVKKEKHFLKFLLNTDEKQQKSLIQTITKSQMNVIIEIIYNALAGNLTISKQDKTALQRYKTVINKLLSKGLSRVKRKKLILKHLKQIILLIKPCEKWLKN